MNSGSSFNWLSRGAKFDKKRFFNDALKLQMVRTAADSNEMPGFEASQIKPQKQKILKRKRDETTNEDLNIFNMKNHNECQDGNSQDVLVRSSSISSPNSTAKSKKQSRAKVPRNERDVHRENVNRIRNANRIHIWGSDIPDPVETFELIPNLVGGRVWTNISNGCGYKQPTPIQMQAIPILLQGRELLACAPTGSGKTLAFLVPVIMSLGKPKNVGFRALVLVPTLELVSQIYRECMRLTEGTGLKTFMIDKQDIAKEKFKKTCKCDILITTPNRLIHLLKQEAISVKNICSLVVDECDHFFEEPGLRDQLAFIYSACDSPEIKRFFFSATCAYEVEEFCKSHLENPIILNIGPKNAAVDLVAQELVFVGTEAGKLTALRETIRKGVDPPVLIFVQSQERAEELFAELMGQGLKCEVIHGGKTKGQRDVIVQNFRLGKTWILVCSSLLARGADFPAVKVVVNYDLPLSPIEYIHSIGRTGRAGRPGRAVTFFTEADRDNLRRIAQVLENSGFPVPPYVLQLPRLRKEKKNGARKRLQAPKRECISKKLKYEMAQKKKRLQLIRQSKEKRDRMKEKINEDGKMVENNVVKVSSKKKEGHKKENEEEEKKKKKKKKMKKTTPSSGVGVPRVSFSSSSKKNSASRPSNWKGESNVGKMKKKRKGEKGKKIQSP